MTINERSFNLEIVRVKDDKKHQAICDAAIELIVANGFADTSMSKIAKAANVSPATIYVYFENKEALLNELYFFVKQEMGAELLKGIKPELPVAEAFKIVWNNFYQYATQKQIKFAFTEQFGNSPLVDRICKDESMGFFMPLIELFNRGKQEKIFKDISLELFHAFTFAPLMGLIKEHFKGELVLDEKMLREAFKLTWGAVTN